MSLSRACGSRQPSNRPNFCCQAGVPGVSLPTSFLSQRAQPTSAAFERSRAAGTTRPLMYSRSLSVWKQNCVLIHARLLAGTYSSQTDGGSTTWLSQSNTGKSLRAVMATMRPPWERLRSSRRHSIASRWSCQRVDSVTRTPEYHTAAIPKCREPVTKVKQERVHMSRFAPLVATLLAVVLLGTSARAQAPRDVVVVGMEAEPPGLDPGQALGLHTLRVTAEIFETLVATPDDSTEIVPGLAESWTTSADGLTWPFKLRKGVRFYGGTPLDAAAVKA